MYASESNPGPYPIPRNAQIEGGPSSTGDRHVIVVDTGNCTDYETWASYPKDGGASWQAGSGAIFPLTSNKLRPATWTSADAAGLPILPGLVRPDEVKAGVIDHAIRVTVPCTDTRFIWPARHEAGQNDPNCPPMGLRLRLKASVDIAQYPRMDRVILQALKTYGVIVADNGTAWYIQGTPDNYWNNRHPARARRGDGERFRGGQRELPRSIAQLGPGRPGSLLRLSALPTPGPPVAGERPRGRGARPPACGGFLGPTAGFSA